MTDDDLVEGRVHRGRMLVAGSVGVALLVALSFVFGLFARERPTSRTASPRVTAAPPQPPTPAPVERSSGRLVYVGVDPDDSGVPRLVAMDVATGTYEVGAEVRNLGATARLVAVGPGRTWLVLIRDLPGRATSAADLIRTIADRPQELARGDWLAASPDGRDLLVTRAVVDETGRCPGASGLVPRAVTIDRIVVATGRSHRVYREPPACAGVRGAVPYGSDALLLNVRRGRSDAVDLVQDGTRDRLFDGVVAHATGGIYAFALRGSELLVWPGGGALRPIVTGKRTRGRIVSASANGRYVVVDGSIGDGSGLWVVDVAAGVVRLGPHDVPRRFRAFAETVADDGTVFLVGHAGIETFDGRRVERVTLSTGAPKPVLGPVVWLP